VRNFFYQIEHYGMVLNGNRTYYYGRSQPPLLSSMVRAIFDHQMQVNKDPDDAHEWLYESLQYLAKEYRVWEKHAFVQVSTHKSDKLAHYFDLFNKVSPEAIGEAGYAEKCFGNPIDQLQFKDPKYNHLFIEINGKRYFKRELTQEEINKFENPLLSKGFSDIKRNTLLTYKHDAAERSSGTDISRVAFENQCADINPVCLNTLLYKLLNDLAFVTAELPNMGNEHEKWVHKASHMRRVIKKNLYDPKTGLYRNKNYKTGNFTEEPFITIVYPLTFNLASAQEAKCIAKYIIENHLTPYGIKNVRTPGQDQWDHIWPIMNYFVNKGFRLYGSLKVTVHGRTHLLSDWAKEIAVRYVNHLAFMNERTGTFHEKLNAADGSFQFEHQHYGNMDQFTWTASVFISLLKRIRDEE
ncbi:MAG: trehalase family glycosidase, partial [Nitrospinota bacterium]